MGSIFLYSNVRLKSLNLRGFWCVYFDTKLISRIKDMKVLYDAKIPLKVFLFRNGFVAFLLFGWNVGLITSLLRSKSHHLKIDEEAVTYVKGLISQKEERVELFRIKDTGYKQGIFERLIGIGKIKITSSDTSSPVIEIPITNPKALLDEMRPLVRNDRRNMGSINLD